MRRLSLILLHLFVCASLGAQNAIDLTGFWDFAVGDSAVYKDFVQLPGTMLSNGKGEQTERLWYQRSIYVPAGWNERHVSLVLEQPSAETFVKVNGKAVGRNQNRFTAHKYDITKFLLFGQRNMIEVSTPSTKGSWQGITGRMELLSQPHDLYIERVKLTPHPFQGLVQIDLQLTGRINYLNSDVVEVLMQRADVDSATIMSRYFSLNGRQLKLAMPLEKEVAIWDEFHPHLYRIAIAVGNDYYETTFGMHESMIEDRQPILNGHHIFLRGIVKDDEFPQTGCPPTDMTWWLDTFRSCKNHGLNLMRFKGYCPPEAAFAAADRLGFYLQPDIPVAQHEEVNRVIDTYIHHPSFLLMGPEFFPDSLRLVIHPIPSSGMDNDSLRLNYYKREIETSLLSNDNVGFELQDYAEVGRLSAKQWRLFCSSVVPLAHFPKADFTSADTLCVPVEVYNAMDGDISPIRASYFITNEQQQVLAGGELSKKGIPLGKHVELGTISVPLDSIPAPQKLALTVTLGSRIANRWDFTISPAPETSPAIKPEESM
jgi:hypothetical protein